jgi:4-amino-4-deoxy-L-arabinose transferase-like glycosyltransferase
MLAATLLHWNRFHQGTFIFYFWTVVYAITPLLVPFLWWRNRGKDTHTLEENDVRFSNITRWALGLFGAAGVLAMLVVFARPAIFISLAPWKLTELTARIFAGWSLLAFSTVISIANDGRWSSTRILLQSMMIGAGLALVSLPRMWGNFDPSKPMSYVYVGGLALSLVVIIVAYLYYERKSRQPQSQQVLDSRAYVDTTDTLERTRGVR